MDTEALRKDLKSKGFLHIYEWHDAPGVKYEAHTHQGKVSMYILNGELTFNFGDSLVTLHSGDYFDVPVGEEHTAIVSEQGCTFLVGEMIEGDS
jgi:quercetin dioxygenase-like cupin family protein